MQMLLFAVAIAVVALMFYDFVSRVGLVNSARDIVVADTKLIDEQLSNDLLCSFKIVNIPDFLSYGYNSQVFPYDLGFSTQSVGLGETVQNTLIISVIEHKKNAATKNIIYAKNVSSDAKFFLIDPQFLLEGSGLENSWDKNNISLYPRAVSVKNIETSSPNSFVALKETMLGEKTLYIIPCSSLKEDSINCLKNILRVGCYKLKAEALKAGGSLPSSSTLVPSCFNVAVNISESKGTTKDYSWADCELLFAEITKVV